MHKKEQELRQALTEAKNKATEFLEAGDNEKAKEFLNKAKEAKEQLELFSAVNGIEVPAVNEPQQQQQQGTPGKQGVQGAENKINYKEVFMKAIKGQRLTEAEANTMREFKAAVVEGTDANGGYLVPQDIETKVKELRRAGDALENFVNVVPVSTNKGSRVIEVDADSTPLTKLDEMGNMEEEDAPTFAQVNYAIEEYAGFLPISNSVLADSTEAIIQYLSNWFAKKSRATRNALILTELGTIEKTTFADYKAIKKALNVTLDPSIAASAKIYTNQDGFDYLDNLMDQQGRPLLQPMPTDATKRTFAGKEVVVLSNKTLATDTNKAPFIVGDMYEAITLFDRQQLSIDMTTQGGNAWRTNSTEMRAIEREDVAKVDANAVVYGQLDITPAV